MKELKPDPVYQRVREGLQQRGVSTLAPITRRFLLRGGVFSGCRFRCGDVEAFWWLDTDLIEFRDANGDIVGPQSPEMKKAA
jgi:hypothetical protein